MSPFIAKVAGLLEAPNPEKFVKIKESCGLTWLKSKASVTSGLCTYSEVIIISSSLLHLQKLDFSQHLIRLSSFHSLSGILGSPLLSLSSSRVILIFDMVAEQCPIPGQLDLATSFCPVLSSHDDSTTTRPTNQITSSSGEKEKDQWKSRLQGESDIKMFSSDPKLNPRLPSPTSFDGVKPSYVEWSEEILTFLSVTDYQEFVPVLQAVTGHQRRHHKEDFHRRSPLRTH